MVGKLVNQILTRTVMRLEQAAKTVAEGIVHANRRTMVPAFFPLPELAGVEPDLLQIVDQSFVEPSQMPAYLNVEEYFACETQDCTANAWIQRESGDTTYVQVDLLQLARNIRDVATRNGSPADQIQYFVDEGTRWTYQVFD